MVELVRVALPRRVLLSSAAAAATLMLPRLARTAAITPQQTEGPFYPTELPADTDSDLVRVTGAEAQAVGQVTHVMGRVLDRQGRPLPGALVEIWQCDANGRYLHPADRGYRRDPGFQGFGRVLTDRGGGYRFRTIRPVAYPGRTPHIHVKVLRGESELLTTQMYVAGERERVTVALRPAPEIEGGALAGTFEIVVAG